MRTSSGKSGSERAGGASVEAGSAIESAGRAEQTAAAVAAAALPCAIAVLRADGSLAFANDAYRRLQQSSPGDGDLGAEILDAWRGAPAGEITIAPYGVALTVRAAPTSDGLAITVEEAGSAAAAGTDPLTRLADRASLIAALGETLARRNEVGLLAIDLERFGAVKISLGHIVADALLKVVADRMRRAVGNAGLAARLGGDEFAVLITGGEQLDTRIESLAAHLSDLLARTFVIDGHVIDIGASIGIAFGPRDGDSAVRVLQSAELALRQAELAGGGVRIYEPAMHAETLARRSLELDLRRALARREFELVYQPQLELATRRVTGFEVLLRWQHPERGAVSPAQFIPLAEETGLIVPIGEWALRTACLAAVAWPAEFFVAVNVSAAQFATPQLAATVLSVLADTGLDPRRLELEITESVLLRDKGAVLALLHRIRALGVRISMDDFGTGYSSLTYLQSFPFDKIKIDQTFIRSRWTAGGAALIRAVAAMGRSLGVPTVAEGVETAEQLASVEADGCTGAQGFFIGRPLPEKELARFFPPEERAGIGVSDH